MEKLLEHINNFHPNIEFTVEVETDSNLPFLDVFVHTRTNWLFHQLILEGNIHWT